MQGALQYGNWTPALFRPYPRSIGGIVAAVTIEERGEDDVQITEHPVEQGAPIADHAFKRPASINIRAGWSVADSYDLSAESGVYGLLLSWQAALMPFDLISGKRAYSNMLIERISIITDQHSEWALLADITCRQIIIVTTQAVQVKGMSDSPGNHKDPQTTAAPKDKGQQSAASVGAGKDYGATGEYGVGQTSAIGAAGEYGVGQTSESTSVQNQIDKNAAAPPNNPTLGLDGLPQAGPPTASSASTSAPIQGVESLPF